MIYEVLFLTRLDKPTHPGQALVHDLHYWNSI